MRSMKILHLVLLLCYCCSCIPAHNDEGTLDVAAFNIQVFGTSKMRNPLVRSYLKKIILQYDLILIQEIRDISGVFIQELLSEVQQGSPNNYRLLVSPRLGRTNSKEAYAFMYRTDWLHPVDSFTFNDVNDVFEREPHVVRFSSTRASLKDFAVAGIHTSPDDAESEISNLINVYDDIESRWSIKDVIIMGDFNAGCSYTNAWKNIKLATDPRFYWLIDNTADTTTKRTDCPYDRIVVTGENMLKSIIPLSPGIFRFDEEYNLPTSEVVRISDHYPVYFKISSQLEIDRLVTSKAINVNDLEINNRLTSSSVLKLRRKALDLNEYKVYTSYKSSGAYLKFTIWKTVPRFTDVLKSLTNEFRVNFPDFISMDEIYTAYRLLQQIDPLKYLPRGHGLYQTLYDYLKTRDVQHAIKLECTLADKSKPICYLQIKRI